MKVKWLLAVACVCMALGIVAAEAEGEVTTAKLNIRMTPETNGKLIGTLVAKDKVTAVAITGEWLQIKLKSGCEVYISSDFIKDGKTSSRVNVRSGPGSGHTSYGLLPAGTPVKTIGEPTADKWVKIEPPDMALGFVFTKYVKVNTAGLTKTDPPKQTGGNYVAIDHPDSTPDMPFKDLPVVAGSGKKITITGTLFPVKSEAAGVKFVLAVVKNGKYEVACFVHTGGSNKLGKFANKQVKLEGTQYKVPKWSSPVLKVTKVTPQE